MNILERIVTVLTAIVYLSAFSLPFAMIPPLCVALFLRASQTKWRVSSDDETPAKKVRYFWLSFFGGCAGTASAVVSLFAGEWWICHSQGQLCHDGQGGLMLMFTIPVLALTGACASLIWTWLRLNFAPDRLWSSPGIYLGKHILLNRIFGISAMSLLWLTVTFGVYWITLLP